jgi:hypothetical protein
MGESCSTPEDSTKLQIAQHKLMLFPSERYDHVFKCFRSSLDTCFPPQNVYKGSLITL